MPQSFWSDERLLVTVRGPDGVRRVNVDRPFALFGSHADCDVVLSMPKIPRRCFCAIATARGVAGVVLGGTSKRAGKVRLVDADRAVTLRSFQVQITATSGPVVENPADPEAEWEWEWEDDAEWAVKWTKPFGTQFFRLPNDRPVLLGRRHPSHIVIPDESLSAVHCCLYRHRRQLWILDLCSSNGTWVQGQALSTVSLSLNDSFRIGSTRIRFVRRFTEENLRSRRRQLEDEYADFARQRGVLLLQQQQWESWRECDRLRQAEQERELASRRDGLALEKQEWNLQREQDLLRLESQTREHNECLSASREALDQERKAWLLTTDLAHEQLALDRQRLEAERANLQARTCELLRQQKRLDEQTNQNAEVLDGLRRAFAETKEKLAKLEAERQEWLVQRLRTQRALQQREQAVAATEQEVTRRAMEMTAQHSQLRRQQQELTDMRRRDLRVAQQIAATHGTPLLSDDQAVNSNHAWNLPALETCLFGSDFVTILDRAIEKANGKASGD